LTGAADVIGLFPPGTAQDAGGMLRVGSGRLVVRRKRWDELLARDAGY
jgi:hypothetical protein